MIRFCSAIYIYYDSKKQYITPELYELQRWVKHFWKWPGNGYHFNLLIYPVLGRILSETGDFVEIV